MDKFNFVIKKGIEQNLWGRPMDSKKNEKLSSMKARKAIFRLVAGLVVFPVAGIIGAFLLWTAIRIVMGVPGIPLLH